MTKATAADMAYAGRDLPLTWTKLSAERQRALFGAVVFGRKEIMHCFFCRGYYVRHRVGKDANGMPKFHERFMSYQAVADWVNQLRQFASQTRAA